MKPFKQNFKPRGEDIMKDSKELTYNLTYKEVVDVLKLINESNTCKELHLELGDLKLTVIRELNGSLSASCHNTPSNGNKIEYNVREAPQKSTVYTEEQIKNQNQDAQYLKGGNAESKDQSGIPIKSPMVGMFYRASAPGEPPFVEVGSKVKEDDIIGIIDVMKLMNTIKAGQSGVIREICVENEQMVEYGQVLMVIEPA